jgi:hypothetical protein
MAERASAKHSAQAPDIARSASCGALVSRLLSRFGDAEAENLVPRRRELNPQPLRL